MGTPSSDGSREPPRWSLRLFGGFELSTIAGGDRVAIPSKRDRVLLAYLVLSPGHRQPRRKLTTLLWGDASDETTLDNLRVCVWSLRKALGDQAHRVLASEGDDIALDISAFDADVLAFRRLAADESGLEAAAALYSGEFLDGLSIESGEYEVWRRAEAARFRDEAVAVGLRLMTQLRESGDIERAIDTGHRVLKLEPLHEPITRLLMRLHADTGKRAAAIQLYRTLAETLRTDLDAQPEAETRALFAEIAAGNERDADPVADRAPASGLRRSNVRRSVLVLAGSVAALIAIALLGQVIPPSSTATEPARVASTNPAPTAGLAVAVLPFTNLSSDAEQEFFSDGITEEITSALARIPNLNVVARTSAFEFKGQNRNIQTIAQQLNATHVIEGSVRKDGDQVRVTAQLIQAGTGLQVWTDSYDRRLVNVFAIQEDIAQAIAKALSVPLGLASGETLVANRAIDPESYQQVLRAKGLIPRRGLDDLIEAIGLLEPIVARKPDFAPAWAVLALAYQRMPYFSPQWEHMAVEDKRRLVNNWHPKAEAAARRAIELDPNLPEAYSALGLAMLARSRFIEAEDLFLKALALDPSYPEALHSYANLLGAVGRTENALATRRKLMSLEPIVLIYQSGIRDLLWINGETETVISNLVVNRSPSDLTYLAKIYFAQGRRAEAADALSAIPPQDYPEGMLNNAVRLLRASAPDTSYLRDGPRLARGLNFIYARLGTPERTLERFENALAVGFSPPNEMVDLWTPIYASVRKTERFKTFVRDAGLVEYWRAKGWPEFCAPTTGDDFTCQ